MMKYFGSPLCPDCVEASRLLAEAGKTLEMTDITASMMNLKEFLALRDRREEFAPVREGGWVGIPCFLLDDGTITFDVNDVL